MVLWFGQEKKAKVVRGGERVRRRCPECGATTSFVECRVESKFTAYSVINLWDDQSTGYMCSACQSVMEMEDTLDPELTAAEREALAQERARALEAARSERAQAKARQDAEIDDELAALKRKLGQD